MIALLVWSTLGWAADRVDPPFRALPDDRLPAIGLGAPTLVPGEGGAPELRRYPLADRGFVTLVVYPDDASARVGFDGMRRTAATSWPPASAAVEALGSEVDGAVGDGEQILLVRARNAVFLVRDGAGRATEVARQILAALSSAG